MDLGFVRDEPIEVERVAPLGDPVEYIIKDVHMSLRRRDADHILVVGVAGAAPEFPLNAAQPGEQVQVTGVHGGRRLTGRLASMGVVPGTELTVIRANGGPVVVASGESRLALGRGEAAQVRVSLRS
jgi:Fe2+ transport system protein FeoA